MAAIITCPFDVIKTHQQIEFGERFLYTSINGKKNHMSTTRQQIRNIYNRSGFRGFFAGIIPRLAKVAPACAIMISTYEYGKTFFHAHNVKRYYENHQELNEIS